MTVTNGDGVSGNPTFSLPTALTFTGKTVTGGTLTGATIENTGIGASTSAAGRFTTVAVTGSTAAATGIYLQASNTLGFATNATLQATVENTASAVNYMRLFGAATGNRPGILAGGSDTNIGLFFNSKGSGGIQFSSRGGGGNINFNIADTNSAVNYVEVTGAAASSGPILSTAGSDTNIDLNVDPKGSGSLVVKALVDLSDSTAGQIKFPASQNASSNANTLDDYEEGTWTPVLTFDTPGDLAVVYTTQVGSYTKIGRTVFANFAILTSSFTHTTASGQQNITGLPFTSANVAGYVWMGALAWQGITKANYTNVNVALTNNSTALFFYASGSGQSLATIAAGDTPTTNTQYRYGSIVYHV